jgi:FkbH-like protein
MYETEANNKTGSSSEIPSDVLSAFGELSGKVIARSVLPWSEHCTECVWPTCYTTCDLYEPREDLRCRRFVDGMVRIDIPANPDAYVLKIRFKQWGKLWAAGRIRLYSSDEAARIEKKDHSIGTALYQLPLPASLKKAATGKRYSFKKRMAQRIAPKGPVPTSFLLECHNPQAEVIPLSLTIRSLNPQAKIPFQKLIRLKPGFQRVRVGIEEIAAILDLDSAFSIEMIPNEVPDGTTLYFGMMDFVEEIPTPEVRTAEPQTAKEKKIKCVIWDLDNTMWDGILVEDGPQNLRLKPGIPEIVKELDGRGILHSIASKNNPEEALQVLKRFQLDEYFLFPQISWQPKSEAVKAIAAELNIGMNTLLFVDDSDFELREVEAACPEVRFMRAEQYLSLPDIEACRVPVTAEGLARRKMYQLEASRQKVATAFGQDYMAFLRDCDITLNVRPLTEANLDRVHELTQRTNQMNFSGNRYTRELLQGISSTNYLDTYVLECEDRFGSYGVIGFSIVDRREPRMTDLMFSCRVQSKRVEHAFLAFLIRSHVAESGRDFHANYRATERNAPSGRVFADLGMRENGVRDGVSDLVFPKDQTPVDDGIVRMNVHRAGLHQADVHQASLAAGRA